MISTVSLNSSKLATPVYSRPLGRIIRLILDVHSTEILVVINLHAMEVTAQVRHALGSEVVLLRVKAVPFGFDVEHSLGPDRLSVKSHLFLLSLHLGLKVSRLLDRFSDDGFAGGQACEKIGGPTCRLILQAHGVISARPALGQYLLRLLSPLGNLNVRFTSPLMSLLQDHHSPIASLL